MKRLFHWLVPDEALAHIGCVPWSREEFVAYMQRQIEVSDARR